MSQHPRIASRLVVAFDPFAPGRAVLSWALRLAPAGATSVRGLFVEESDALVLGAFPWAREVATATGQARPLQARDVERDYLGRAAEARALFDAMLAGVVDATFEQVRGRPADELRRVATGASAILVDWPAAGRRRGPRTSRLLAALLELAVPLIGLVSPRTPTAASIVIVSAGETAQPVRDLAQRLAAPAGARIARVQGPVTAAAIVGRARAERADTVLVQRRGTDEDRDLLIELALAWPGSLLLLR